MRRLPKRGFSNYPFKKTVQVVNLDRIQSLGFDKVDVNTLIEQGVVKKAYQPVKILSSGELTSGIDISADMFSKVAVEKIEKAGGKVTYLWWINF